MTVTEPFPEQAHRAVPGFVALSRTRGRFVSSGILERHVWPGGQPLVGAKTPRNKRKRVCVWTCLLPHNLVNERPATYRPSILSNETNENREQQNRKLMRKHDRTGACSLGPRGSNQSRSRFRIPASPCEAPFGSPRRRVASLPRQTAELGGGRFRSRFLQTAPEGTTPAWSRRTSRNGVNEGMRSCPDI